MARRIAPTMGTTGPRTAFQLNREFLTREEMDLVLVAAREFGDAYRVGLVDAESVRAKILEKLRLLREARRVLRR